MRKNPTEKLRQISELDAGYWAQGLCIAGIDEAGRGPLAGPVVAGCVVMPREPLLLGVDDSKKLSEKMREQLYAQIMQTAVFVQTGWATVEEIERLHILQATRLAMQRAAQGAPCGLFLIDAIENLALDAPQRGIVHGDAQCYHIAAASIVAKVTRDRRMRELDAQYPGYGFARHKGYGTVMHIEALRRLGPCPEHRRSFIGHFVEADV
ncbi:MAG: ribonuclease HII [Clostridia bacterium]